MMDILKPLLIFYAIISVVLGLGLGLMFGANDSAPKPFTRRIHYVVPAYCLGYWLAQPVKEET